MRKGHSKLLLTVAQFARRLVTLGHIVHDDDHRIVIASYQSRLKMTLLSGDRQDVIDLDDSVGLCGPLKRAPEQFGHLGGENVLHHTARELLRRHQQVGTACTVTFKKYAVSAYNEYEVGKRPQNRFGPRFARRQ